MPLPSLLVSDRSHWTDPVSREETLARGENSDVLTNGHRNHKPQKTKKIIAFAENVWDRYVTRCGPPLPVCCDCVSARLRVLRYCVSHVGLNADQYQLERIEPHRHQASFLHNASIGFPFLVAMLFAN
jgi:hypothetical protein